MLVHRLPATQRVIGGTGDSGRTNHYGVRNRTGSDEQDLWDGIQLRQHPSSAGDCRTRVPPTTVVTDIEGGVRLPKKSRANSVVGGDENGENVYDAYEPCRANGIYTSVRMEQSVS